MKISHSPPGVYLMMLPPLAEPATKLEKKNAPSLATQVGPSFHVYANEKLPHTFLVDMTIGVGNGPIGQEARPDGVPPPAPPPPRPPPPARPAAGLCPAGAPPAHP